MWIFLEVPKTFKYKLFKRNVICVHRIKKASTLIWTFKKKHRNIIVY